MRLFHSPTSPYVRKVMVLLHETGLLPRVELVAAQGTPVDPGSMPVDRNPLGKIPALETDEGVALYDSRVICRYLDDLGTAGLYPPAPALWEVLTLEATADGILDAAILMVYESRVRPEERRHPDWVEGQWAKIARALDAAERRWSGHLAGPLDMGQIALGCALAYLDFRHSDRPWRAAHPHLAAWEAEFSGRASMLATRPSTV
ncbi:MULTISPECIES: glutathione S-transferase [Gemmobacter]|jgi:glutathione S-transferase|uniref:Glutathione S-transferase n=2 Tax=Gemmobacter TaxID=204456 RepID=A0A2T6AVT1_9RHOB|nr:MULTISPECIES: glutathione S-transferase [Gemmobacter]PTX47923.1 glutathione S-transferase [Gemmobacter caeni]TWI97355.1 glutathione S-transferase [Gemmobacter caeni]GHC30756.1 glutathione S-transferase [Gemmobacter nanjingensis]